MSSDQTHNYLNVAFGQDEPAQHSRGPVLKSTMNCLLGCHQLSTVVAHD